MESIWILQRLKSLNLLQNKEPWWWPNALSFEVVVSAILTQNTKWSNVESSLFNLKRACILSSDNEESLENLANIVSIENLIAPSGFYRQKSSRLIALAKAIKTDFGSFASFCEDVNREWLLAQKGIGFESADSILNYACGREVMVVDRYSFKFLAKLGIEIFDYNELQAWFMNLDFKSLSALYGEMPLAQIYARYHGKIVEFSKAKLQNL